MKSKVYPKTHYNPELMNSNEGINSHGSNLSAASTRPGESGMRSSILKGKTLPVKDNLGWCCSTAHDASVCNANMGSAVQVLTGPLPIQLLDLRQQKTAQLLGLCHPCGRQGWSSRLLLPFHLIQTSCRELWGSELADEGSLSLCVFPFPNK